MSYGHCTTCKDGVTSIEGNLGGLVLELLSLGDELVLFVVNGCNLDKLVDCHVN
jgi:hypothetical protein